MFFIFLITMALFVYVNSMFYTLALLSVTCVVVFLMVSNLFLQPLTGIIILLVYLGAMMILVGYICAVSPNFIVNYTSNLGLLMAAYLSVFFISSFPTASCNPESSPSVFFFSSYGFSFFLLIAVMLFVVLLMVTSHYFSPKGPFRSVS